MRSSPAGLSEPPKVPLPPPRASACIEPGWRRRAGNGPLSRVQSGPAAIREWRNWTTPGAVATKGRLNWLVRDLTRRLHMPMLCVGERLSNCLEAIRRHTGLRRSEDGAPGVACGADRWLRGPNEDARPRSCGKAVSRAFRARPAELRGGESSGTGACRRMIC